MTKLSQLKPGECGVIISVGTSGRLKQRMNDMGIICGARIFAVRSAPFGDPFEYRIHGSRLALRRKDAEKIIVERDSGTDEKH